MFSELSHQGRDVIHRGHAGPHGLVIGIPSGTCSRRCRSRGRRLSAVPVHGHIRHAVIRILFGLGFRDPGCRAVLFHFRRRCGRRCRSRGLFRCGSPLRRRRNSRGSRNSIGTDVCGRRRILLRRHRLRTGTLTPAASAPHGLGQLRPHLHALDQRVQVDRKSTRLNSSH